MHQRKAKLTLEYLPSLVFDTMKWTFAFLLLVLLSPETGTLESRGKAKRLGVGAHRSLENCFLARCNVRFLLSRQVSVVRQDTCS